MVVLHLVDAHDAGLIASLRGAGLPDPGDGRYFTAHEHGGLAGYVGLEGEGRDLLLRSLVVLADMKAQGPVAGVNFWAWNGEGRAQQPDAWFKKGDKSYVGDPPQEEQGLFGVFDADASTLAVIAEHAAAVKALA